ncbi:hypothetical protein GGS23DRAFT_352431 [Durotheca rogersii]|uniref:uncharacterized protein n=1 Tax=Durotheca rogersii TaxID=419775 RepID=UPI00221ECFB0|nr:uncharacterized protein GGS23DRAFT_352431 [Durotheca rogersii]KAI5865728.1 hypothetical protein GGS23DRAFT_352431 [Durotheca rogersii]
MKMNIDRDDEIDLCICICVNGEPVILLASIVHIYKLTLIEQHKIAAVGEGGARNKEFPVAIIRISTYLSFLSLFRLITRFLSISIPSRPTICPAIVTVWRDPPGDLDRRPFALTSSAAPFSGQVNSNNAEPVSFPFPAGYLSGHVRVSFPRPRGPHVPHEPAPCDVVSDEAAAFRPRAFSAFSHSPPQSCQVTQPASRLRTSSSSLYSLGGVDTPSAPPMLSRLADEAEPSRADVSQFDGSDNLCRAGIASASVRKAHR